MREVVIYRKKQKQAGRAREFRIGRTDFFFKYHVCFLL